MFNAEIIEGIQNKYASFSPYLNERTRRIWAGIEAKALGYGGVSAVSHATGLNRNTIAEGIKELETEKDEILEKGSIKQIRKTGGGRKHVETIDSTLIKDLEALVEPTTRGDPESPLRWTCKSTGKLIEIVLRLLSRRCGQLPIAQQAQVKSLPINAIESLAEALLDFNGMNDLEIWLRENVV